MTNLASKLRIDFVSAFLFKFHINSQHQLRWLYFSTEMLLYTCTALYLSQRMNHIGCLCVFARPHLCLRAALFAFIKAEHFFLLRKQW